MDQGEFSFITNLFFFFNLIKSGIIRLYYMALSHKDWELPNSRIRLAKTDIDRGVDFPI